MTESKNNIGCTAADCASETLDAKAGQSLSQTPASASASASASAPAPDVKDVSFTDYVYSRDRKITANPLTAVLPDFSTMTIRHLCKQLEDEPDSVADHANRIQRSSYLMSLASEAFFPLSRHIQLHNIIVLMLKLGYRNRSINETASIPTAMEVLEHYKNGKPFSRAQSSLSASVVGCSGIGKSYAIEQILGLFPQAVRHHLPDGQSFVQVIYLKVDCPADGSVKVLFTRIITELANLVEKQYSNDFHNSRRITLEILMARALELMDRHKVGLLVIDEIQNLVHCRNNHEILFNFMVSLSNTLKIPILYAGTPKALQFFQDNLRIARRFASCGIYAWERLVPDSSGLLSGEWGEFVSNLWKHGVLKNDPVSIPEEIGNALFECSQGVIDVLMKLFVLSEMRELELGRETLSVEVIHTVFREHFKSIEPMINALKRDDVQKIREYQDLTIPKEEFESAMAKSRKRIIDATEEIVSDPDLASDEEIINSCLEIAAKCGYDTNNDRLLEMLQIKIKEQTVRDSGEILVRVLNRIYAERKKAENSKTSQEQKPQARSVEVSHELPVEDANQQQF